MRVAIYTRVSTAEQAQEGYSLSAQRKTLEEWAVKNGHEVITHYEDAGLSAKNTNRPALQEMLEAAKQKKFDAIIVWALSRFTRSVFDLYNIYNDILEPNNIKLVSATEGFDTNVVIGRVMMGLLGILAQMERELTSERVKLAFQERAEQGKRTCSDILGYDKLGRDHLVINEHEAEIVRFIFKSLAKGRTLSQVAQDCDSLGYKGKRGAKISVELVRRISERKTYLGYYHYHRLWYKGNHEAIISAKLFNKVQKQISAKYKSKVC